MITWEWLSGFFDGEGYIAVLKRNGPLGGIQVTCIIAQSGKRGEEVLSEIKNFLAKNNIQCGLTISTVIKKGAINSTLPQHRLFMTSRVNIMRFTAAILPHSRVKRTELLDVWRFLKMNPSIKRYLRTSGEPTTFAQRKATMRSLF